ncbi:Putative 2-hydroxyacid dehydrogenase HI_1556 [Peribacillus sp. Bi96]|uniref:D-2-hydroxyacid dehydrogenase n=1 Tax=unclassified Peribacillus TaxID=2675266 RepID=UPI001E1AB2AD|nr:D-2-hydroxyacid dehydrogenase [Peribacillus sp. Bi96]CAH0196289.1 Putative 2-hydroxyacid dehydrogenase HI_1556 [Peribacillus sp. Bi96]
MSESKKAAPSLYIRVDIPEKYINELKEFCSDVVVEPWEFGEPEPQPAVDLSKFDVLYTMGLHDNLSILKKAPKIEWVHSDSAGVEAMLNEDIQNRDVTITNVKGCTSVPIAEHTIAMLFSLARGMPTMIRNQMNKKWVEIPVTDLENSTVGIIGYGDIGFEIAKRCKALGMTVIGCRRNPAKRNEGYEPADLIMGMDQVDEVLSRSDFVVLALPFTKETSYFLNEERLNRMKKGSYLINVGRGNTIVDEDLIESLSNGHIAGAALDVFEVEPLPEDHPFWQLENVIVSPHNAYNSAKHLDRVMQLFLKNLKLFSEGKPLMNVVEKKLGY